MDNSIQYYFTKREDDIRPVKLIVEGKTFYYSTTEDQIDFSPLKGYEGRIIEFYNYGRKASINKIVSVLEDENKITGFTYEELEVVE